MSAGRRAVFFDRDDTLIHDVPYNGDPAKVRLIDGVHATLAQLREAGFRLFILSNQSGVGRGKITRAQVDAVNAEMLHQIGDTPHGDPWFDDILICPHAPQENCLCRKPKAKLPLDAVERFGLSPRESYLVGDKASDVQCALNAGMRPVLFEPPHKATSDDIHAARLAAAYRSDSLLKIAHWICQQPETQQQAYNDEHMLGYYVWQNFKTLYTDDEYRFCIAAMKAIKTPSITPETQAEWNPDRQHPETQRILRMGLSAYWHEVAQRILATHGEDVFINRCDKCGKIVASPTACLCKWCSHSWYDRRQEMRDRARSPVYTPPED